MGSEYKPRVLLLKHPPDFCGLFALPGPEGDPRGERGLVAKSYRLGRQEEARQMPVPPDYHHFLLHQSGPARRRFPLGCRRNKYSAALEAQRRLAFRSRSEISFPHSSAWMQQTSAARFSSPERSHLIYSSAPSETHLSPF